MSQTAGLSGKVLSGVYLNKSRLAAACAARGVGGGQMW